MGILNSAEDRLLKKISDLEWELEQYRWRKVSEELPDQPGMYLVSQICSTCLIVPHLSMVIYPVGMYLG